MNPTLVHKLERIERPMAKTIREFLLGLGALYEEAKKIDWGGEPIAHVNAVMLCELLQRELTKTEPGIGKGQRP